MIINHLKSFCGIIKRGKTYKRKKFLTGKSEIIRGNICDVFVNIWNLINGNIGYINFYIERHKIKMYVDKFIPVNILNYFEEAVIDFENVKKMDYGYYFIKAFVNEAKTLT